MVGFKITLWILGLLLVIDLFRPYYRGQDRFRILGKKGFLPRLLSHSTAFVTILSFYFAIVALNETRKSGIDQGKVLDKQQKALDESRTALNEMVKLAQQQRELLAEQADIATKQADFNYKQLNRKPVIKFFFGNIPEEKLPKGDTLTLSSRSNAEYKFGVAVRNTGDTIAYRPALTVVVNSKTVHVRESHLMYNSSRPNYMVSTSYAEEGISRYVLSKQDYVYDLRFLPDDQNTKTFTVEFVLTTTNGFRHTKTITCSFEQ